MWGQPPLGCPSSEARLTLTFRIAKDTCDHRPVPSESSVSSVLKALPFPLREASRKSRLRSQNSAARACYTKVGFPIPRGNFRPSSTRCSLRYFSADSSPRVRLTRVGSLRVRSRTPRRLHVCDANGFCCGSHCLSDHEASSPGWPGREWSDPRHGARLRRRSGGPGFDRDRQHGNRSALQRGQFHDRGVRLRVAGARRLLRARHGAGNVSSGHAPTARGCGRNRAAGIPSDRRCSTRESDGLGGARAG